MSKRTPKITKIGAENAERIATIVRETARGLRGEQRLLLTMPALTDLETQYIADIGSWRRAARDFRDVGAQTFSALNLPARALGTSISITFVSSASGASVRKPLELSA